jgi:regulatory protein YycI of two-component signal transduction system YycFG
MDDQISDSRGNTTSGNKSRTGFYILLVILIAIVIVLGWLYLSTNNKVDNLEREKEHIRVELQTELDSVMTEHAKVKKEYASLVDTLTIKDSVLIANAKEIKRLLNTEWEYYKVKKKLDQLREISQGYLHQIDSLYRVNQALQEENITIRQDLQEEQQKSTELTKDKEQLTQKITEAAILTAYNISTTGIRFRGGDKEKVTIKASKVDKIKICFTLGENKLIQPGIKDVYIRIARPDNMILAKGLGEEYSFMYRGEKLQYSILEEVQYEDKAVEKCTSWINRDFKEPLMKGKYVINIFVDDNEIGQSFFELE